MLSFQKMQEWFKGNHAYLLNLKPMQPSSQPVNPASAQLVMPMDYQKDFLSLYSKLENEKKMWMEREKEFAGKFPSTLGYYHSQGSIVVMSFGCTRFFKAFAECKATYPTAREYLAYLSARLEIKNNRYENIESIRILFSDSDKNRFLQYQYKYLSLMCLLSVEIINEQLATLLELNKVLEAASVIENEMIDANDINKIECWLKERKDILDKAEFHFNSVRAVLEVQSGERDQKDITNAVKVFSNELMPSIETMLQTTFLRFERALEEKMESSIQPLQELIHQGSKLEMKK